MTDSYELPHSSRWSHRWGHFAPQLLTCAILAAIALGVRPHSATMGSLVVSLALITFVLATWLKMRVHDRRLCEDCAAAMPLNPMQDAARFTRRFYLAHQGSNPRVMVPYLIVLVGSNFLTDTWGRYAWAVVQATMIYLILSTVTHRKLQPWCPWCSGGGGGTEREQTPEPTGPRGNNRQLV